MKKILTKAQILINIVAPIVFTLLTAGATYGLLVSRLDNVIAKNAALEAKVYANENKSEGDHEDLLKEVAGMTAKIDYIYDWVKELRAQ